MKVSKTAIFLFELMVVILIFSIAAAVCTSAFGKAYGFSEDSKALTMAVLKAESIAEEFKAGKIKTADDVYASFGIEDVNATFGLDESIPGDYYEDTEDIIHSFPMYVFFDKDWKEDMNLAQPPKYVIIVDILEDGELSVMDISVGGPVSGSSALVTDHSEGVANLLDEAPEEVSDGGEATVRKVSALNEIYDLQVKSYGK